MRIIALYLIIGLCLLCLFACAQEPAQQSNGHRKPQFRHDADLFIEDPTGEIKAEFKIEIARTDTDVMRGLKFRDQMDEDQAMLFIFEHLDYHTFWMQDTYLSLDMIFIGPDGYIVHIEKDTTPFSEDPILPSRPNLFVLEVLAGTAEKMNIKESDIVRWQDLQN